jgi:acyl carrier protein
MKWRWWRTADEMAADFAADRMPEPDEQFIAACDLPDTPDAVRVALAVRRSVANYGMIASEFIRATDGYPEELVELSGWDSIDFLAWVFELERELGMSVSREAFKDIRQPFTVKDLVLATYRFAQAETVE